VSLVFRRGRKGTSVGDRKQKAIYPLRTKNTEAESEEKPRTTPFARAWQGIPSAMAGVFCRLAIGPKRRPITITHFHDATDAEHARRVLRLATARNPSFKERA